MEHKNLNIIINNGVIVMSFNIDKELIKLYEELIDIYKKELQKEIKSNKYLNDTIDRLINE